MLSILSCSGTTSAPFGALAIALTTPWTATLLWGFSASTLARVSLLALPLLTVTCTFPSRSVSTMKTIPPWVLMLLTHPKMVTLLPSSWGVIWME